MAFVNEAISEDDQRRIGYSRLMDPQSESAIWQLPRWTIDRAHEVFLLYLGGGMSREDYHVPFYFLFSWKDVWMRVDAYRHEQYLPGNPKRRTLTWEVIRMHLPDNLPASREEVMQLLTEAFYIRGSTSYDELRALFSDVRVDYSKLQIAQFDLANVIRNGK